MLSPTEVVHLLRENPLLIAMIPSENIKAFNLPEEMRQEGSVPVMLITDVRAAYTRFASDHASGRYRTVQIQAWFDLSDGNIEAVQDEVNQTMEKNKWFNSYDAGIATDPDTSELFFTMQYSKNQLGV
jgi:hypothetical protein